MAYRDSGPGAARQERESSAETDRIRPETETSSEASWAHIDRNEDAALGHVGRLEAESRDGSRIDVNTDPRYVEADRQLVRDLAKEELRNVNRLDELNVSGVLDGVSGSKKGEGMIASRLAAAEISAVLSGMDGKTAADPSKTKEALKSALLAANDRVRDFKRGNPDRIKELEQTGCTAELMRLVERPDGSVEVAFAHAGDGALLHFDAETGEIKMMTKPHDVLSVAVDHGAVTEEERRAMMSRDESRWPLRLAKLKKAGKMLRQGMVSNINGKPLATQIEETQMMLRLLSANGRESEVDLGVTEEDVIQTGSFEVKPGDMVIPCSDGLIDNVPRDVIARIVRENGGDLTAMRTALAMEAVNRGGGGFDPDTGRPIEKHPDAKGADDVTFEILRIPEEQLDEIDIDEAMEISPEEAERIREAQEAARAAAVEEAMADIEELSLEDIEETVPEPPPIPEGSRKKGGFFNRLFGRK